MPQDEFIIRLFCSIDETIGVVKKYPDERLHPSEVVTLMVLFAIKGGRFAAFYRWVKFNHEGLFPQLPEKSRLSRLFVTYESWCNLFLADASTLGIIDTYGIELLHPRREGRSEHQVGRKGISNGRWIVGIKGAFLINQRGEIIEWAWDSAEVHDSRFNEMVKDYQDEMVVLADSGFRQSEGGPENMHICKRGEWNDRYLVENIFRWMTDIFNTKKIYHRTEQAIHMRMSAIAAAFNILLRMNNYCPSMTWFAL